MNSLRPDILADTARAQRLDKEAEPGRCIGGRDGGYLPKKRRSRA